MKNISKLSIFKIIRWKVMFVSNMNNQLIIWIIINFRGELTVLAESPIKCFNGDYIVTAKLRTSVEKTLDYANKNCKLWVEIGWKFVWTQFGAVQLRFIFVQIF